MVWIHGGGFASGHAAPIPFVIGTNDHEASLFPDVRRDPAKVLATLSPRPLAVARRVYDPEGDGDGQVATGLTVDRVFAEPARLLAHSQADTGQPVWRYRFSYVQTALRGQVPGAGHAAEVQFVFGSLGVRGPYPTAQDRKTAEMLQIYWTNFAKVGDPNGTGLPIWPKDPTIHDETLAIDQSGGAAKSNLDRARLTAIAADETPPTR